MQSPRRERRKLEIHGRILEAASALFLEHGFQVTKIASICERADVAQQTFFNHFPTKQHLLSELAVAGNDALLARVELARKEGRSTRERITLLFGQIADAAGESGPKHREFLNQIIHASYRADDESVQARRMHDAFASIVRDGLDAGDITQRHTAETLTEMIQGAYYVLMFNWANLGDYPIQIQARAQGNLVADAITLGEDERTAR